MSERPDTGTDADGIVRTGEWIGVGNEFTGVRVRKVFTRQGERLEIQVPRHGHRILLDPMQLEIIAVQEPAKFSELFARRFGSHEEGDV
ncbi:hypothetical protein SRB5_42990 [Streptomyces sp. RB5]|uniref:Uncharacterized protein n=1 Tax=Streptomyces smaragdinus TaxID=2585196 RepID=A0A7K0CKX7_9ACTN|nr:hypothetical protein [Streptomyces smaragdinus]MQY14137.1 hypothetical protein [Streptomyces smaragdinus]